MARRLLHPIAGGLALLLAVGFWVSTALSEALGDPSTIIAVKTTIPWLLPILVLAIMATALSGRGLLSRDGSLPPKWIVAKQRRMPLLAFNGFVILIPAALYLSWKGDAGVFDSPFILVQALELLAGAINIALLILNARDGIRKGRRRSMGKSNGGSGRIGADIRT